MLDPRIYRTGLVAVAVAVILFAFSLSDQAGGLSTTLAPDSFNGQNAYTTMRWLAQQYPHRSPGATDDAAPTGSVALYVAQTLSSERYSVSTHSFTARTARGTQTLENVTGVLAGQSQGSIVIVAPRDALDSPGVSELSGTGVLLELARVLAGQTLTHTVVIASISGSLGGAGSAELARSLPGPVDAVIVLGDLTPGHLHQPFVIPWSHGLTVAPPVLRNTLAGALAGQAQLKTASSDLGGQILHLAFPMSLGQQAAFNDLGAPAVELSLSGERTPTGGGLPTPAQAGADLASLTAAGRALLQSVSALDAASPIPAPSSYLIFAGKVIPLWAVRLVVLALIFPVAITMVDAVARTRRRGHALLPWLGWLLACAAPFMLAAVVVLLARLAGLFSGAPGGPVPEGVAPPHGGGLATIILASVVLLAAMFVLRPWLSRLLGARGLRRGGLEGSPGAAVGISVVLCLTALGLWVRNPYAALLLVPALHLWMWLGAVELRIARPVRLLLVVFGLAPVVMAVVYYAMANDLTALQVLWNGVLMIVAGQLGLTTLVLWSIAFGCFAGVLALAVVPAGLPRAKEAPITVRGPISYAGPGSLGGTKSALRR